MKSGLKSLTVLLAILGIGDLAMVPFMIAANHHNAGTRRRPRRPRRHRRRRDPGQRVRRGSGPPVGLHPGYDLPDPRRRQLGPGRLAGPDTFLKVVGGIGLALSVAAIVLLIRLNPRRALRRAASRA